MVHPELHQATSSEDPITHAEALAVVRREAPDSRRRRRRQPRRLPDLRRGVRAPGLRRPGRGATARDRRHHRRGDGLPLQPASLRAGVQGLRGVHPVPREARAHPRQRGAHRGRAHPRRDRAAAAAARRRPGSSSGGRGSGASRAGSACAAARAPTRSTTTSTTSSAWQRSRSSSCGGSPARTSSSSRSASSGTPCCPGSAAEEREIESKPLPGSSVTMDEAAAIARRTVPDGRLVSVSVPDEGRRRRPTSPSSRAATTPTTTASIRATSASRSTATAARRRSPIRLRPTRRCRPGSSTTGSIRCTPATS